MDEPRTLFGAATYSDAAAPAAAPAAPSPKMAREEMAEESVDQLASSSLKNKRVRKDYSAAEPKPEDLQQAAGAKAILSEGIPDWHWHTVTASWNTPVANNKLVRIGLMPPWLSAIVGVLSAAGLWWAWLMAAKLLWGMGPLALPARPPKPPKPPKIKQPEPSPELAA